MPLYALSAAHANDQAKDDQYVLVAAGLMFFFSAGAIGGPFFAALFAEKFGAPAMFIYTSLMHGMLVLFTILRSIRRPGLIPRSDRRFVPLIRTSPQFLRLATKDSRNKTNKKAKDDTQKKE